MAAKLEAEKVEVVLGIDNFNKPAEATGAKAWGNLIAELVFMTPGTMPTDPEMGCDIQKYEFSFIDDVRDEIEQLITDQVHTYYPDIPFDSLSISHEVLENGNTVLLIQISFILEDYHEIAVVAAEKTNSIINFAVAV